MPNEKWEHVKEIFDAALWRTQEERAEFLDEICANDETVRREVESLLSSFDHAENFMNQPVVGEILEAVTIKRNVFAEGHRLGHYEIIEQIGAGGMGEVYLAQDTRLNRRVALKVLPAASLSNQEANQRLWREARAAATLDHPNICAIHEIAETDSCSFIVMHYVEGETLAEKLNREKMNLCEVLKVAVQVADALVEAHACGIIHRDIKPGNIIINDKGQAKVLDFGLAKFADNLESKTKVTTAKLISKSGAIMGTVPYMSPEQVRGKRLDARTDIFSFGAMLYEASCGRQPFARETDAETISAILRDEPSWVEIPAELQPIVQKALMKNADERYQTATDLSADLRELQKRLEMETAAPDTPEKFGVPLLRGKLTDAQTNLRQTQRASSAEYIAGEIKKHKSVSLAVLAISLLAIGGLGLWGFSSRSANQVQPPSATQIRSIAMMPLENLSGDLAQEYFADGMTESLINKLAQIRALRVISRASVMRYKRSQKSVPEIARELNVDAVIIGSVQRSGGRVRVTAQLIHGATDAHLWARDYERDLTDVLRLESEVARAVADEIRIQLTAEERARMASARSVNPQAHEAYLLGRYHLSKNNAQDWVSAIEHFRRAIGLAPDNAEAYAGLSEALVQQAVFGIKPSKENVPPARDAALKAIGLDEQLAEGHTALGNIKYYYDWDWAGAENQFERALELNPASLIVQIAYGHQLSSLGRHDEAVRKGQFAVQLDPLSSEAYTALGRFLYRARRYEEALPVLLRAVQLEPRSVGANTRLGSVYAALGNYDEALAVYEKAREVAPSIEGYRDVIGYVYARMGREEAARQIVSGMKEFPIDVAAVYAALNDKDGAFRILEEAIAERKQQLVVLKEDPTLESLHSDARWKELLRRMNFPAD
jgi:serine/threonine protein kinase/Flp pilus assembly protein TadD